jgi:multidrug transporter EmrE-like cation transporter
MVITNLIWNLASNILVTLSGVFLFGESIQTPKWLAIGMSLVSLAIFAYND